VATARGHRTKIASRVCHLLSQVIDEKLGEKNRVDENTCLIMIHCEPSGIAGSSAHLKTRFVVELGLKGVIFMRAYIRTVSAFGMTFPNDLPETSASDIIIGQPSYRVRIEASLEILDEPDRCSSMIGIRIELGVRDESIATTACGRLLTVYQRSWHVHLLMMMGRRMLVVMGRVDLQQVRPCLGEGGRGWFPRSSDAGTGGHVVVLTAEFVARTTGSAGAIRHVAIVVVVVVVADVAVVVAAIVVVVVVVVVVAAAAAAAATAATAAAAAAAATAAPVAAVAAVIGIVREARGGCTRRRATTTTSTATDTTTANAVDLHHFAVDRSRRLGSTRRGRDAATDHHHQTISPPPPPHSAMRLLPLLLFLHLRADAARLSSSECSSVSYLASKGLFSLRAAQDRDPRARASNRIGILRRLDRCNRDVNGRSR